MWVEVVFRPAATDFEARRRQLRETITNADTLRMRLELIDDEESRWDGVHHDDRRRYTYWINGRLRPRLGDRVRVPTLGGSQETEATVVRLVRDEARLNYEGPFDEVLEITRRAPRANRPGRDWVDIEHPCVFRTYTNGRVGTCGRIDSHTHRHGAIRVAVRDEVVGRIAPSAREREQNVHEQTMLNYLAQDAAITAQMRESIERNLERELLNGPGPLSPGSYPMTVENVEEDDQGLVVTARVHDSVIFERRLNSPDMITVTTAEGPRTVTDVYTNYADQRVERLAFSDGSDLTIHEGDSLEVRQDVEEINSLRSMYPIRIPTRQRCRVGHPNGEFTEWFECDQPMQVHAV